MLTVFRYLVKANGINNCFVHLMNRRKSNNGNGFKIFEQRSEKIREFSTTYSGTAFKLSNVGSEEELNYYKLLQPQIVDDISTMLMKDRESIDNYKNLLIQTSLYYTHHYGFLASHAYQVLVPLECQTEEKYFLASILGWCADLLNLTLILHDDILDNSEFRNSLNCWHKRKDVGMRSVIDIVLIENAAFLLLKKHFSSNPSYVKYIELFHEIYQKYALSCQLDFMTKSNREHMIKTNTIERYKNLVLSHTTYPSVILPLFLTMDFVGENDPTLMRKIKPIAYKLGEYMTAQDDIVDCFGDISASNNDHSDIVQGKFTWLLATAMEQASTLEKEIIFRDYGQNNPQSICNILEIYSNLKLLEYFEKYEKLLYAEICTLNQQLPDDVSRLFNGITNTIFHNVVNNKTKLNS